MDNLVKLLLFAFGLVIIGYSIHFYIKQRDFKKSLAFYVILITCLFLFTIIFFPNLIIGMEFFNMNLDTAQHYYSIIVNIIIGFSASIGIGLTILSTSEGEKWGFINSLIFLILLVYFILVMYFVYLLELSQRMAFLN